MGGALTEYGLTTFHTENVATNSAAAATPLLGPLRSDLMPKKKSLQFASVENCFLAPSSLNDLARGDPLLLSLSFFQPTR